MSLEPSQLPPPTDANARTVWGLDSWALHDRFWASRGIQVVRPGDKGILRPEAKLFLLIDNGSLVLFEPDRSFDLLQTSRTELMFIRVHDLSSGRYREQVITGDDDGFVRFERLYHGGPFAKLERVLITEDRLCAALWQVAPDVITARRKLLQVVPKKNRCSFSIPGKVYHSGGDADFIGHLIRIWKDPTVVLSGVKPHETGVWVDPASIIDPTVRFVPPVWAGTSRQFSPGEVVVGPVVLWDSPGTPTTTAPVVFRPFLAATPPPKARRAVPVCSVHAPYRQVKRLMDIVGSLCALAISLPLYPFIMLAIYLEDGRPFFFAHRRETLGGRKFPCLKFRSMRKDAEIVKRELALSNKADGPQFFMEHDPRLTRIGRILRKLQLDELPQFLNVLVGHMSLVGPRPSPFSENQFCPPWRETRLSVRAGLTGLWQVSRTRSAKTDFQEWIRFDIKYCERVSLALDLMILWRTFKLILKPLTQRLGRLTSSGSRTKPQTEPNSSDSKGEAELMEIVGR